jgi:hypothetical protein
VPFGVWCINLTYEAAGREGLFATAIIRGPSSLQTANFRIAGFGHTPEMAAGNRF